MSVMMNQRRMKWNNANHEEYDEPVMEMKQYKPIKEEPLKHEMKQCGSGQ
jgi:hypothetical protein